MTGSSEIIRISPAHRWFDLRVRDLWAYRELLYFFTWRDVKVRYKQTVFGASWAIIQPLLLMVVFTIFLGNLAGVPSEGIPYPIFSFAALVPWTLFAQSVSGSALSLVGNANLVSKVYFPRLLLPTAVTASYLLDFLIALTVLLAMMAYYGFLPTLSIIWVPAFVLLAVIAALAVGIFFAALNARYRDVQYAVPFIVQVWLFATPVAYPGSLVSGPWRILYGLNPMAGVVEGFRWSLLGVGDSPGTLVLASAGAALIALVLSLLYFHRVERTLADVI